MSRQSAETPLTSDEERAFYDNVYSRHLALPDHALATNRSVMLASLDDPAQTIYERRRLYAETLNRLFAEPLSGMRVLDYGCGPGEWGVLMATEGAHATLLDLSPSAIELGLRRARASGVDDRVRGYARDASDLSCFDDGEFDLIFASAALHHTLKYPNAFAELLRVLKPGGKVVLAETYGNNPLLNGARRLRALLAREAREQGEGIILSDDDIELLHRNFRQVDVAPLSFLAMAKRLFRGKFHSRAVRALLSGLEAADQLLLTAVPSLRRYCGEVVIVAER